MKKLNLGSNPINKESKVKLRTCGGKVIHLYV